MTKNDAHDDPTLDTGTTDDTTQLEQEQTVQTDPTERLDTTEVEVPTADETPQALPERPSGPHAPAIVLGLVCLAVAGIILAQELGDLSVDWGDIGPVGIIVTGAVLVLFGLVGLLSSRRDRTT